MEPINKILSQDLAQLIESEQPTKSASESAKQERVMDRLWQRLSEIYGYQLVSQFGTTIPESWAKLLTGITPDQIKTGLENLVHRTDNWPPNSIEFRNLCLPKKISPDGTNTAAYLTFDDPKHPQYEHYNAQKRLPDEKATTKRRLAGNAALVALKGVL